MNDNSEKIRNWVITISMALFIIILAVIGLIGMWKSFCVFAENQQAFSKAYSNATTAIANITSSNTELARIAIDHLEALQTIQKNAVTNDIMSFLYSTLTTILIGLCAGFVIKSRKHSEETSENAKKSLDYSLQAQSYAEDAKKIAEETEEKAKSALNALNLAKESYDEQKANINVLNVHIEILHTRAALISDNRIAANDRFYSICKMVSHLPKTISHTDINYIRLELLKLYTPIDEFLNKNGIDNDEKSARENAAKIYKELLKKSIEALQLIEN